MIRILKDKQNIVIILLSLLFIFAAFNQEKRFIFWVLCGLGICFASEYFLNNVVFGRSISSKGALISGFIVSGILDYRQPIFFLFIFCLLAVISKHFIRIDKRHIFNPATLALFPAVLFRLPLTWSIESNTFLIIAFGLYFAYSNKKFPQIAGFLIVFSFVAAFARINPLATVSWFFLFVMLIDPETSDFGTKRGFVFGAIAGVAAFLFLKFSPTYDIFISSLFVANLLSPLLRKIS